jgi:hypothetical protein
MDGNVTPVCPLIIAQGRQPAVALRRPAMKQCARRGEPVKSCVHCEEMIQDRAASCRFCGKAQPVGVVEITERGRRYGVRLAPPS